MTGCRWLCYCPYSLLRCLLATETEAKTRETDNRERRMENGAQTTSPRNLVSFKCPNETSRLQTAKHLFQFNARAELFYVFCFVAAAQLVIILTTVEAGWDHKKLCKKLSLHIDLLSTHGTCAVLAHLPSQRLVGLRAHVVRLPSVPLCCSSCHLMLIHLKCQFVRSNRLSQRFNRTPPLPISSPPS